MRAAPFACPCADGRRCHGTTFAPGPAGSCDPSGCREARLFVLSRVDKPASKADACVGPEITRNLIIGDHALPVSGRDGPQHAPSFWFSPGRDLRDRGPDAARRQWCGRGGPLAGPGLQGHQVRAHRRAGRAPGGPRDAPLDHHLQEPAHRPARQGRHRERADPGGQRRPGGRAGRTAPGARHARAQLPHHQRDLGDDLRRRGQRGCSTTRDPGRSARPDAALRRRWAAAPGPIFPAAARRGRHAAARPTAGTADLPEQPGPAADRARGAPGDERGRRQPDRRPGPGSRSASSPTASTRTTPT